MSRYRVERSEEQVRTFIGFCLAHKDTSSLTAILRLWRDEHPKPIPSPLPQAVFFALVAFSYLTYMMGARNPTVMRFTLLIFAGIVVYALLRWYRTAPIENYTSPYDDRLKSTLRLLLVDKHVDLGQLDDDDVKLLAHIFENQRLPERLYYLLEQKSLLPTA